MTGFRIPALVYFLVLSTAAFSQVDFSKYPYLLRLEHESYGTNVCVLLQKSGAFHLEAESGDSTKIYEGVLPAGNLRQLGDELNDEALTSLSQDQIDEPLLNNRDLLQIDIFRTGQWQDLVFHSIESEEPYRRSLQPLVRWLDGLHKLPHKELSEDEGKNNCLTPGKIVLKKREEMPAQSFYPAPTPAPRISQPTSPIAQDTQPAALLRLLSMRTTSGAAEQRCVLVNSDGAYRTEQRVQKIGSKKVETRIDGGKMAPPEISELQQILNDRTLTEIRHHKTSKLVLPMSGEMLNLQVPRSSGLQDVVLSSTFNHRDVPFFYSGDGDIASARTLLNFLADHVENNQLGALDPGLRNDCTDAP